MLPLLLVAACTEDHHTPPAAAQPLPPGAYPLQIASLTVNADTRLADNGNVTSWQPDDQVMVSLGDRQAVYTYHADGTWHSDNPLCWESTEPQTVNAWYPVADEIDFTHQDQGLTYLLKADPVPATYDDPQPLNLTFRHQLAKVRVLLDGTKATEVASVTVRNYPQSANNQGALGSSIGTPFYVPMLKTEYNGQRCWEATLRPGSFEADNTFEVAKTEGDPVRVTLAKEKIPVIAGEVTTITINVEQAPTEIDLDTYEGTTLTVSGKTTIKGDGTSKDLQITVEPNTELTLQDVNLSNQGSAPVVFKGDATLTLEGANTLEGECVAWDFNSGSGIYIEQGTLTINADNENASLTISRKYNMKPNSSAGMGIHVPENASLIIKSGKITVNDVSSEGDSSGAGIGTSNETCGNITIEGGNITVGKCSYYTAGIGSLNGDCKGITITGENTVVNVSKGDYASCYIGSGIGTVTGNITIDGGATVNGVKYTETHTGPL